MRVIQDQRSRRQTLTRLGQAVELDRVERRTALNRDEQRVVNAGQSRQ
jgi:hypothetical protein